MFRSKNRPQDSADDNALMHDGGSPRLRVLSVHNLLAHENIPVENFLHLDSSQFQLEVLSLYQTQDEVDSFLQATYPESSVSATGANLRKQPFRGLGRTWRFLRSVRPDVMHVNHAFSGLLAGLLSKWLLRSKIIMTVHSDFRRFQGVQKWLLLATMGLADMIVCNSENTYQSLNRWRARWLRRKFFRVCYNGVNLDKVAEAVQRPEATLAAPPSRPFVVGFVGRLAAVKDVATLLRGFARLHHARPGTQLAIVGEGPLRADLERLAADLGVRNAVQFYGAVPRKDVYRLLSRIDVAVVSSRWEGFCNAMVEAMCAGKPVVASDIPVLREVLGSECGRFFSVGREDELGDQLTVLHDDEALRNRLGAAAQRRAREKYSLDACATNYAQCYQDVYHFASNPKKAA